MSFVLGGAVAGGQILGEYPSDISSASELRDRRAMIPTTSYESVWNAISLWMGVEDAAVDRVIPNRANFATCTGLGCGLIPEGCASAPFCSLLLPSEPFRTLPHP